MTIEFTVEHDHTYAGGNGIEQLVGWVTASVSTRPGDFRVRELGGPTPRVINLPPRKGYLASNGHMYKDETQAEPFRLVANDPSFNLRSLTYRFDFDLTTLLGVPVEIPFCWGPAPSTDTTLYLTKLMNDVNQPVVEIRTKGYAEDILDAGAGGIPVLTSDTLAEALSVLDAAPADQGRRILASYTSSTPDIQVPAGIVGAFVTLQGAGGGAGSGRRGAAGTIRQGGGGGASGSVLYRVWLPATWFGDTFNITIGVGGTGGAAVTTDDTDGNSGTAGGTTILTSNSVSIYAPGGDYGRGGSNGNAGSGGWSTVDGIYRPGVGRGGSASADGSANWRAASPGQTGGPVYEFGSSGGGSGGGITSSDVAGRGGDGGACLFHDPVVTSSGRWGGFVDGDPPGYTVLSNIPPWSRGPGGGAASITTTAQDGGSTVAGYGCGGGGGGASLNGHNSGAGSAGANGWAMLEWVYG